MTKHVDIINRYSLVISALAFTGALKTLVVALLFFVELYVCDISSSCLSVA